MLVNEAITVEVPAGSVLTVVPGNASATGSVKRLTASPGDGVVYTAVAMTTATLRFGPYPEMRNYRISCTLETLSYTVLPFNPTTHAQGTVPSAVAAYVAMEEKGTGSMINQTLLTLTELPQAVVNGTEYQGTEIFNFPLGRILVLGVVASIAEKTTSAIATTLNSGVTGALALGTATASNVALTSTMADLLPSTAFLTSTVINVAAAAVAAALAASAQFDGSVTAKKMFINTCYATTGDIDADATQTLSGTILISWINLSNVRL